MMLKAVDALPSRRAILALAAGTALSTVLPTGTAAHAGPGIRPHAGPGVGRTLARLREIEQRHAARLGAFAWDTATGQTMAYRADERFPICSVFKTLAAAAVLRDLDRDGSFLAMRITYTAQDVAEAGYAPITGQPENLANGMTVSELCAATICYGDNTAANLLLRELGGPTSITRFCRSVGDGVTRLDRWEPALNSAEPDRVTDTTSPRAIGRTYARLSLGHALARGDRELLTGWLLANTTGGNRLRAGLPEDWMVGDKTGTGQYGTTNDVGIAWPPGRAPIVLAVLSTKADAVAAADEPLVAETAAVLVEALG